MEAFKNLMWPIEDAGTDLEKIYHLDMHANEKSHFTDVFYTHLLEIDRTHLVGYQQKKPHENENKSDTSAKVPGDLPKFFDPRTNVEITSHICDYREIDLSSKNIMLSKFVQMSKLRSEEHSACISAIENDAIQRDANQSNQEVYEATESVRAEEKQKVLEILEKHYFANLSHRYHAVPPPIDHFVLHIWEQRLMDLYRRTSRDGLRLRTALAIQTAMDGVSVRLIHQEHYGLVREIIDDATDKIYVRQSFDCLLRHYNQRRNSDFVKFTKEKTSDLMQKQRIDFLLPMSIINIILCNPPNEWSFRLNVKGAAPISIFDSKKEFIFEKPLPPLYLSGNERYRKASKYLLRTSLCNYAKHVYDRAHECEIRTKDENESREEISMGVEDFSGAYKVSDFYKFMERYSKKIEQKPTLSGENKSFSIYEISNTKGSENDCCDKFNVLILTKQDAYRRDADDHVHFVNLSPKLEFQAEYGVEVMTKSELIREWCQCYFRPHSTTERVCFDCESGEIIKRKSVDLSHIENELKNVHGIESGKLLRTLFGALRSFYQFPAGDYLLQNDVKHPNCIKVYEKCDKPVRTTDICTIFKNVSFEKSMLDEAKWMPIDTREIVGMHRTHQILPCAFPHFDFFRTNNLKKPPVDYKAKKAKQQAKRHRRGANQRNVTPAIINPKDDSRLLPAQMRPKQRIPVVIKKKISANKMRKKAEKRAHHRVVRNTLKAENDALDIEKKFAALINNYTNDDASTSAANSNRERLQVDLFELDKQSKAANRVLSLSVNRESAAVETQRKSKSSVGSTISGNSSPANIMAVPERGVEPPINGPIVTRSGRIVKAKKCNEFR